MLLEIAREIGIYVMPVGVVDSAVFTIDWPAHLQARSGTQCDAAEMPMESGQEIPHSSQDPKASEWVKAYKPPSGVVYCEASVHGSSDTSTAFSGGSFICTHVLRDVPAGRAPSHGRGRLPPVQQAVRQHGAGSQHGCRRRGTPSRGNA